jgi:hypothetical protein
VSTPETPDNDARVGEDDARVPCGAFVVTRWYEGHEQEVRWCERTDGPCPFPGADHAKRSEHLCGASGTRRLRVQWAETCIDDALGRLLRYRDDCGDLSRESQDVQVAIDALRACGATYDLDAEHPVA